MVISMGEFGFSYIGLLIMLLLAVPNLIWTKAQGYGMKPEASRANSDLSPAPQDLGEARGAVESENRVLVLLERTGQILTTCIVLIFRDFNLRPWSPWSLWLIAALFLMALYECWWVRYFRSERELKDFYSSFLGIPVAGAVLPVAAFLLLGIYGRVIWLLLAVVILGIGHIGIHLQHRKHSGDMS